MTTTPNYNYTVPGLVPALAQPSDNTCWATSATMMVSWHDNASYTIEQVMDMAGQVYRDKFTSDQGLASSEKADFLAALGLQGEPPMDYTVDGLLSLLQSYGPLWATTDEDPSEDFAIHARIITGMSGDGSVDGTFLQINDPADGQQHNESFREFAQKFDQVAGPGGDLRIQIVHYDGGQIAAGSTPTGAGTATRVKAGTAGVQGSNNYVVYESAVRVGGTRAWRNNNPGNIVRGSFTQNHGDIGTDGRFAIFPDEATGMAALLALLLTSTYQSLTIKDAIFKYAPPNENDSDAYVKFIQQQTGLDITRQMSSLNTDELNSVAGAIQVQEGWRAGNVYSCSDTTAPEWIRPLLGC